MESFVLQQLLENTNRKLIDFSVIRHVPRLAFYSHCLWTYFYRRGKRACDFLSTDLRIIGKADARKANIPQRHCFPQCNFRITFWVSTHRISCTRFPCQSSASDPILHQLHFAQFYPAFSTIIPDLQEFLRACWPSCHKSVEPCSIAFWYGLSMSLPRSVPTKGRL